MLESKVRTPQEQEAYLKELREWLSSVRDEAPEEMADFFYNRIGIYEDRHLGRWAKEYEHIADYFPGDPRSLLDIGCGTGLELASVFRRFDQLEVTGIDLSGTMLGKLREKYPGRRITLIQADYFAYPLGEERFGAALSFETLHHFKPDKKQALYEKLCRAIKRGGCYLECDYVACCDEEERLCLEGYEYRRQKFGIPPGQFVHIDIPLTLEHQLTLLKNAGFQKAEALYENRGTVIIRAKK